jgi:hypothetical protein
MSFSLEASIFKDFGNLEDPRIERTKQHPLISIVAIAILAVICGADSWVAIETYACAKRDGLEQFLELVGAEDLSQLTTEKLLVAR